MISNLQQHFVFSWIYNNKKIFLHFAQEPFATIVNSASTRIVFFEYTHKSGTVFFYQPDGRLIKKIDSNNIFEIPPQNIFYDNNYLYIKAFKKNRKNILNTLICKLFNISGISQSRLFFYKLDYDGKIICSLSVIPQDRTLKKSCQV